MNKEIKDLILKLRESQAKTAPMPWGPWQGNYPFYVVVNKPRPSLSKHDEERPTYWHYDDAVHVLNALHAVPKLIEYIESLEKSNET